MSASPTQGSHNQIYLQDISYPEILHSDTEVHLTSQS